MNRSVKRLRNCETHNDTTHWRDVRISKMPTIDPTHAIRNSHSSDVVECWHENKARMEWRDAKQIAAQQCSHSLRAEAARKCPLSIDFSTKCKLANGNANTSLIKFKSIVFWCKYSRTVGELNDSPIGNGRLRCIQLHTHSQSLIHSFIRSVKYLLGVDIAVKAPSAAKLFLVLFPFSQSKLTMATVQHQIVDKLIHRQMKIDTKKKPFECEFRQSWWNVFLWFLSLEFIPATEIHLNDSSAGNRTSSIPFQ